MLALATANHSIQSAAVFGIKMTLFVPQAPRRSLVFSANPEPTVEAAPSQSVTQAQSRSARAACASARPGSRLRGGARPLRQPDRAPALIVLRDVDFSETGCFDRADCATASVVEARAFRQRAERIVSGSSDLRPSSGWAGNPRLDTLLGEIERCGVRQGGSRSRRSRKSPLGHHAESLLGLAVACSSGVCTYIICIYKGNSPCRQPSRDLRRCQTGRRFSHDRPGNAAGHD